MSRRVTSNAQSGHVQQLPAYDGHRSHDDAAPLRTRGPFRPPDCWHGPDDDGSTLSVSVGVLVSRLRAHVFGLPLTLIVHGWGGTSTEEFLKLLKPSLLADDALWFIPAGVRTASSTLAFEGAIVLDLTQEIDRRLYDNLVPDLVFFPAEQEDELERIRGFERRAGPIILDGRGLVEAGKPRDAASELKARLIDAAYAHSTVCRWTEGNVLVRCTPDLDAEVTAPARKPELPAKLDMDKIGEHLKAIVVSLAPPPHGQGSYVRRQFRTLIDEVMSQNPAGTEWDKELILQADAKGWPDWTVPCLPSVHVTLSSDDAGGVVVFTWDEILTCVPPELGYTVEEELCGGRILKVKLEPAAARIATDIATIFEASLSYWMAIPSASERSFLNVLNDAMLQAEGYLCQEGYVETAERVGERRAALVRAMLSIA